jgi:hypothetical protein
MPARAKIGDVLEVVDPAGGFVYVHYAGRRPVEGDAIAVCPAKQPDRVAVTAALFRGAYFTFYPASKAVREGLAKVVGHLPPPALPTRWRRPGAVFGRDVKTWLIDDAGRTEVRRTEDLSAEERLLPHASIWNHAFLIGAVSAGWRPERSVRQCGYVDVDEGAG